VARRITTRALRHTGAAAGVADRPLPLDDRLVDVMTALLAGSWW